MVFIGACNLHRSTPIGEIGIKSAHIFSYTIKHNCVTNDLFLFDFYDSNRYSIKNIEKDSQLSKPVLDYYSEELSALQINALSHYINRNLDSIAMTCDKQNNKLTIDRITTAIILTESDRKDTIWISQKGYSFVRDKYFKDYHFLFLINSILPKEVGYF